MKYSIFYSYFFAKTDSFFVCAKYQELYILHSTNKCQFYSITNNYIGICLVRRSIKRTDQTK